MSRIVMHAARTALGIGKEQRNLAREERQQASESGGTAAMSGYRD